MEKLYETYAKQVQIILQEHREEAKKIADAVQKLNTDKRYTQQGKDEMIEGLRKELNDLNKTKTDELKKVVVTFCDQYQVIHAEEKADAQEVANALKVIDMCGYDLTADLLRSVVEPLKKSYASLKMISQLLHTKHDDSLVGGFSSDVILLIDDYIGENEDIIIYEDIYRSIREVLEMPELCSAGIIGISDSNGQVVNRLTNNTPYAAWELGDNMMKLGHLYDSVHLEWPRLFR